MVLTVFRNAVSFIAILNVSKLTVFTPIVCYSDFGWMKRSGSDVKRHKVIVSRSGWRERLPGVLLCLRLGARLVFGYWILSCIEYRAIVIAFVFKWEGMS